ncbi:MAG: type II toxin-antitoxin system HicA family toxin [Candidatus Magasanikbacteria bacterium]|nr:type II toxin-antitoxin system HicA family toxin [Candidatus Magasanikbacteria bacterium]
MPRPIPLKYVLKVLKEKGFFFVRQKGSHARYEKETKEKTFKVTVKVSKKEIPHGTFMSILLQSGLQESDFRDEK